MNDIAPRPAATLWAIGGSCLALALGIRVSDHLRIVAKGFIDPLFHSTSDGATLFLLCGSATMACVLASVASRAPGALPLRQTRRWSLDGYGAGFLLLGALAFAHGIGFIALLEYQDMLDLPWQLSGYHWSGEVNTYNTLLHSHVGKTALSTLAQPLQWLGGLRGTGIPNAPVNVGAYDTGAVLIPHVATVERWAIALLFSLGCVFALVALPSIADRYRWHPVALALYGFAAMNCLKTVVDGGLLTYRLPPSALVLTLLVTARDREDLVLLARRYGLAALCALVAYVAAWAAISQDGLGAAFSGFLGVSLLYAFGLLCWAFRNEVRAAVRWTALAVTAGYLGLGYLQDASSGIGLLLRALPDDARVVVIDPVERGAHDASAAVRGQTPLAIYRRFGDDPMKPKRVLIDPRPVPLQTRGATAPERDFAFALRVIEGGGEPARDRPDAPGPPAALDAKPTPSIYQLWGATRSANRINTAVFVFRTASSEIPGFYAADSNQLGHNNFYVHLHQVAATLRAQGLEEFVLMPLHTTRDRDLFIAARSRP
ncbi:MAG: hypothetical protein H7125_04010 [Proteobacteria bacterium]|nr:hypothetical protein [Burkholderiales bacterium]